EDDAQAWKSCRERCEHGVDEALFPIEYVDLGIGNFSMHLEDDVLLLHSGEDALYPMDVGHAGVRMGGCPCRVELEPHDAAARPGAVDLRWIGSIREVERHQGLECQSVGEGVQNSLPIGLRLLRRDHRWPEVRHDE